MSMTARIPKVTIGLPVHNGERYLPAAIRSLLDQTWTDFELIISDNASTDGTEAICRAEAESDERVRYYRHGQNRGAVWNFTEVANLARGEYFKWASADDACAPTFIERCVEALDSDTSVVCCHTKTLAIDQDGYVLHRYDPTHGHTTGWGQGIRGIAESPHAHRRFRDVLLSAGWNVRSYGMFRARSLRQVEPLRSFCGSEKILMAELSLLGRYFEAPEALFHWRVHPDSLGARPEQEKLALVHGALLRIRCFFGYAGTISRSPVSLLDKALCYFWLLRYLAQLKKLRILLGCWLRGKNLDPSPPASAEGSQLRQQPTEASNS